MKKTCLIMGAVLSLLSCSLVKRSQMAQVTPAVVKKDSVNADSVRKPKKYSEIIKAGTVTRRGLLTVHQLNTRWYFEVPDSLLERDILIVNRIAKAAAEFRITMANGAVFGYAGDEIAENVVRFSKLPNNRMAIKKISYLEMSRDSSENGLFRSIRNSTLDAIAVIFDIKAISPDSSGSVIDITDYLNTENDLFYFDPRLRKAMTLGDAQADKSMIKSINTFPLNTEIRTVRSYRRNELPFTYELNSSIVLLPKDPMRPRFRDPRVGYFARVYLDYDLPVKRDLYNMFQAMTTRWRLEPKPEDLSKYLRGELVEPQKPIIFYIDPATPKKWVSYLVKGVDAWKTAFEKAGFKNAIYALEAPVNDTSWSMEDARHNMIVYKGSFIANASGPNVHDPRTGEIIESHINWYDNVQYILHDWYFVQAAQLDTAARKMQFSDELMGRLIQYVCTHEVGHTLGLQHNFMASTAVPVDSLRNKEYIARNGHTPSIMDYARFNYVAQPGDGIAIKDLIPKIGVYDEWAIEWGYRWKPPFATRQEEESYFGKWVIERTTKDPRLLFTEYGVDVRVLTEDLGDNAIKAGRYGIKNLKYIMSHLKDWTDTPNDMYGNMKQMYRAVTSQYRTYIFNSLYSLTGAYWIPRSIEQKGRVVSFPDRDKWIEMIRFIQDEAFTTPSWLEQSEIFQYIGGGQVTENIYDWLVYEMVSTEMWGLLHVVETFGMQKKPFTFDEYLSVLETGIFSELAGREQINYYRRYLQKTYITRLINNIRLQKTGFMGRADFTTLCEKHIQELYRRISKVAPGYKDETSRIHLEDIARRLKAAIDIQLKQYPEKEEIFSVRPPAAFTDEESLDLLKNNKWLQKLKGMERSCWQNDSVPGLLQELAEEQK